MELENWCIIPKAVISKRRERKEQTPLQENEEIEDCINYLGGVGQVT